MRKLIFIVGMLLSGCTFYTQNNLDLTVLKNGKPVPNYDVELRLPRTYGQPSTSPDFNSREMISLGKFSTDNAGKLNFPLNLAVGINPYYAKPMFFISSSDIKQCELLLWYLEKEKFFVPLKFKNGNIVGGIKYLDDVTGNFTYTETGWDVSATIHRSDRICEE